MRRTLYAAVAGLALLTLLAALPGNPAGPFDARTWERAEGFRLEQSGAGIAFEPFIAISHALAGAPDYRVAIGSTLVWVFVVALILAVRREVGRVERAPPWLAGLRIGGKALGCALLFAAYMFFGLLVHLPSWRLVAESDNFLIADLQTHTLLSHDGLVSARHNLELHGSRGCDVVAITEHNGTMGAALAEELAEFDPSLPGVIPGVEIRERGGGYLLGIGLHMRREEIEPLDLRHPPNFTAYAREKTSARFPRGAAVIALAWKLKAPDIARLADAGVDGFELVNFGHPGTPEPVRQAMLTESKRPLAMVASSDWHGWGGFWRTWTAVRVLGAGGMPRSMAAEAVQEALLDRRSEDIFPIVAGRLGPPSLMRAIFAPLVEAVRYARELSPLRVLSWWIWAGVFLLFPLRRGRPDFATSRTLLMVLLSVLGTGLIVVGTRLLGAFLGGRTTSTFPAEIGFTALGIGVGCAIAAAVTALLEVRRKGRTSVN